MACETVTQVTHVYVVALDGPASRPLHAQLRLDLQFVDRVLLLLNVFFQQLFGQLKVFLLGVQFVLQLLHGLLELVDQDFVAVVLGAQFVEVFLEGLVVVHDVHVVLFLELQVLEGELGGVLLLGRVFVDVLRRGQVLVRHEGVHVLAARQLVDRVDDVQLVLVVVDFLLVVTL